MIASTAPLNLQQPSRRQPVDQPIIPQASPQRAERAPHPAEAADAADAPAEPGEGGAHPGRRQDRGQDRSPAGTPWRASINRWE